MIDGFAKEYLHGQLRTVRQTLVWKLDGLSEYDVRRPLAVTGTNLLGIMVHVLQDTTRHAGHADILREKLDGRTGVTAEHEEHLDPAARENHRARVAGAAREAAGQGRPENA
ncbi:MAG TPA: DUF664 domain-containing protein [Actinoplanes sp.]|nr:DUF664 domain-containing protein [Actinoplanes sp.]